MTLLTKITKALPAVVAVVLELAVSATVTQAQSNNIIDSVTENISQADDSLGKGGSCNKLENISSPVRAGQQAFLHWVDRCGERSELEMGKTTIGETYWLGWSMYLPMSWENSSESFDIVAQWAAYPTNRDFGDGCGGVGSKMSIRDDNLRFDFQHQGDTVDIQCDKYTLGNINDMKGKWVDFVMHVKWTGDPDGFLKLWMKVGDDSYVQKVDYTGRTFWNDEDRGPYFKMGLYKGAPDWDGPGAPRFLYTDEYHLGDFNSSFEEVAPGNVDTNFSIEEILPRDAQENRDQGQCGTHKLCSAARR